MKATRHLLLLAPVLALAACAPVEKSEDAPPVTATARIAETTTTTTTGKPTACQPVPAEVMSSIAKGLYPNYAGATFTDAYGVVVDADSRNERGWPGLVVAARITGNGFTDGDIGTWAIRATDGNISPIYALNTKARQATEWGAAANPGSPADEQRKKLEKLGESKQAEKCAKERKAS